MAMTPLSTLRFPDLRSGFMATGKCGELLGSVVDWQ
jgi:hypothetical protein